MRLTRDGLTTISYLERGGLAKESSHIIKEKLGFEKGEVGLFTENGGLDMLVKRWPQPIDSLEEDLACLDMMIYLF